MLFKEDEVLIDQWYWRDETGILNVRDGGVNGKGGSIGVATKELAGSRSTEWHEIPSTWYFIGK